MSQIAIRGNPSGGGNVDLLAPASAVSRVLTLPDATATLGVSPQLQTAVTLTNQTFVDFTGIPSWVKRVNVLFNSVSSNGASPYLVQLGAGSIAASGYNGAGTRVGAASSAGFASTAGLLVATFQATDVVSGKCTIDRLSGNVWEMSLVAGAGASVLILLAGAGVTLGGALDRIRLTTVNGTDQFDTGTVNISWE